MHDRIPYHCPEKKIPKSLRRSTQITPGAKAKMVKVIIHPEKTNLIWCHGNIHQLHKYYNPGLQITLKLQGPCGPLTDQVLLAHTDILGPTFSIKC